MTDRLRIREARLPEEKPLLLNYVEGLQRFEAAFESNRRLDGRMPEEYFATLLEDCTKGKMFVAEIDGQAVGWVVVHEKEGPVFVTDDERRCAYIAELFVEDAARGHGVGRALIGACEEWARAQGLATIQIGYIAGNARAGRVYQEAGYAPYAATLRKRL